MKKKNLRKILPVIIMTLVGAVGGYLYYRFVGCASGTCAITSNPAISTVYGGILGGLLGTVMRPGSCCACSTDVQETDGRTPKP